MKPDIHPEYPPCRITCACGNVFQTRSTKPQLRTDLCNVCHPFYTGEQRIVDTAGQVERFMKRMEHAQQSGAKPSKRQQRIAAKIADRDAQHRRLEENETTAAADEVSEVEVAAAEA